MDSNYILNKKCEITDDIYANDRKLYAISHIWPQASDHTCDITWGETSGRGGWISNDHCWGKLLIRSDHWQISYASLETSESRISKSGFIKSAIKNKLRIRRSSWIIATKTLNSLHKCSKGILTSPMQLICYYFPIQYSLEVKRPLSYNGT